jgi:adenosylhomocysteine nucleosidase
MVGIVFATRREADPFLELASAVSMATEPLPLYKVSADTHPACMVAISGMGKVAAALAAAHLVLEQRAAVLINAGLCGCMAQEKNRKVGHLLRIASAVEGDCDRFGKPEDVVACDGRWFRDLESARLVTCDRPVFATERKQQLSNMGDLADMEGAAVARTAHFFGIPCAMLKAVSDCADESGRENIGENIARVSARIAETLAKELRKQAI